MSTIWESMDALDFSINELNRNIEETRTMLEYRASNRCKQQGPDDKVLRGISPSEVPTYRLPGG